MNDETETEKEDKESIDKKKTKSPMSRRKLLTIGGIAIISTIPLGLGTAYFISPTIENNKAETVLQGLANKKGPVTPENTTVRTFTGEKIQDADANQKALDGKTKNDAGVFVFGNGKNVDQKTVDIYIDFNSQKSRDFLLINQTSFKNMIENGIMNVRIHPVPSGNALSMYSAEALAESFVSSPNTSWDFMMSLLKLSANIESDGNTDILGAVEKTAQESNVKDVSKESIQKGTFSSWIIAVGNDKKLETGYYPPIMYVNGTVVSPDTVDFNDPDAVKKEILNRGNK